MTRPIYASGLLRTAQTLSGVGAGRGRPALSDLRRSTSTAYYALFHQIIRHGAFDFLPAASESDAAHVSRWYTHTGVLSAAGLVIDAASTRPLGGISNANRTSVMALRAAAGSHPAAFPSQLVTVADAFQSLQEARHEADYDGNYDPVRAVTVNHVQDADAAVRGTWSLWNASGSSKPARQQANAAYRTFLRLALVKSGGPKAR